MQLNKTTVLNGQCVLQNSPPTTSEGIPMLELPGTFNGKPMTITITDKMLSTHTLLIGGTGSGKTNVVNFYIHQLKKKMTPNDIMIIFDSKGDFFQRFYKKGDFVLSNSKKYADISSKWNIYKESLIDGWDYSSVYNNVHEILRSFFLEAESQSSQPFFPNAARDLLASIIIAQIRMGENSIDFRRKYFNNFALKKYLDSLSPKKIINLLSHSCFKDLSAVLSYIGDGSSNQSLGVLAELQRVMRTILYGSFAEDGRFSVRDFTRNKGARTLFVEYDMAIGALLSPVYRVPFDLALKEAMGRNKPEGNVYLICDEFKLLPNLQHIEDGVNFGRGLGVKIIACIQSIEQLYEIYGESKGRNIAAGFSTVFAFRANDTATRNYISNLYGKNVVLEQYRTSGNTLQEKDRIGMTVEDWDLINLVPGQAVIGFPFKNPFVFHFKEY